MEHRRTVFFDFDGVITDSFAAALATSKKRCMHMIEEVYRKQFEGNSWLNYDDIGNDGKDHSQCNHNLDWFGTFSTIFRESDALFGMMDSVVRGLAKDYRLIIVSSSSHGVIASFLKTHQLDDCFEEIMDANLHTSKSVKIGMAFEKYGITPDTSIMITDSKGDILEAREKGVECIGVSWGFNSFDVLASANPFRIVNVPDELPNAINEFFHGKGTAA
jgi:phosphoglycolate phosphatase-like HAD superfamily hydrolase